MKPKRQALGRGLDSLIPMDDVPASGASAINEIDIELIQPNPDQPRSNFDEESLAELAVSIRELGIIQPISLRSVGGNYQIIAGERRYRAARMAGLSTVPAYIRVASDSELTEMALIENIQREDLNAIEIALTFKKLIERPKGLFFYETVRGMKIADASLTSGWEAELAQIERGERTPEEFLDGVLELVKGITNEIRRIQRPEE